MKTVITIILALLVLGLTYVLILNIKEPIAFQEVKNLRKTAVVDQLKNIRTAQEIYRAVTGKFSNNFDSLEHVIKTDSIRIVTIFR